MTIQAKMKEVLAFDRLVGALLPPRDANGQPITDPAKQPSPLPIRAALQISLVAQAIISKVELFNKLQRDTFEKYAPPLPTEMPPQGPELVKLFNERRVHPDKVPEFQSKIQELLDTQVEIAEAPVPLSSFGDYDVPLHVIISCTPFFDKDK